MEKLELKHLAPYFPYGLNCEILNYNSDYVGKRFGVIKGYYFYAGEPHYMFNGKDVAGKDTSLFKPILRHLSGLNVMFEHNDVQISPLLELAKKLYNKEPESFDSMSTCIKWVDYQIIEQVKEPKGYDNIPHWSFQDLIKWHFDVFGLIDTGLAVDINTLSEEVPYV